ncbi:hypothetical protein E8E13_003788 [Curvularia kusanoi]|uniref:Uncharacterized protein n=1 Tax=Curvularia kusanoi TaxID=90978 RepID=A0A9P4T9E4_CURKU|nr:hypothetical protein E8E13_003788 [Curvularia kusanoi]
MSTPNFLNDFPVDDNSNLNDFVDFTQFGNAIDNESPSLTQPAPTLSGPVNGTQEQPVDWQSTGFVDPSALSLSQAPQLNSPFTEPLNGVREQSPSGSSLFNGADFGNSSIDGVALGINEFGSDINAGNANIGNAYPNPFNFNDANAEHNEFNYFNSQLNLANASQNDFDFANPNFANADPNFANVDPNFANVGFANANFGNVDFADARLYEPVSAPVSAPVPAKQLSDAAALEITQRKLAEAQQEIERLKAASVAATPATAASPATSQQQSPVIPRRTSQGSSHKRKSSSSSSSSPKRQQVHKIGSVESLWSRMGAAKGEGRPRNSVSPRTPPSAHRTLTPPSSGSHGSHADDQDISPADLLALKTFNNGGIPPSNVTPPSNNILLSNNILPHAAMPPTLRSSTTVDQRVNMDANPTTPKKAAKRAPKTTPKESTNTKVVKKTKTTPEKAQQQQQHATPASGSSSTSASASTPASAPTSAPTSLDRMRPIEELLEANFNSLNAQEKLRVLLPLLRKMDPRNLEASLVALPSIRAKGPGHESVVARSIYDCPNTPEAEDHLASLLTFGRGLRHPPAAAAAAPQSNPSSHIPSAESSSSSRSAPTEDGEQLGAERQRKAIEKAAMLDAQGRKR